MESKENLKATFYGKQSYYERLGNNLEQAIKSFLDEESIGYLSVYFRVKGFDSFYEKVGRKNYANPFNEVEDFCGVRIICYYVSDISKIEDIIKKEFKVLESQNKAESLGLKEFAYRSVHYIVQINDSWTIAPNYRGLQNLKAEIQIRTVLMHAWAEIEHKLNYKSDAQVPDKFQRTLFRLSAKFEEADEQFEELKNGINEYKSILMQKIKTDKKFDVSQSLDGDSFMAFLNFHFPNANLINERFFDVTFDGLINNGVSLKLLNEIVEKYKSYYAEIAKDLKESGYRNDILEIPTEFIGFTLQLEGKWPYEHTEPKWRKVVEKWKNKLQNQ